MKIKSSKINIGSLFILLIIICVSLCGCANVNFVTTHLDNGSIQEYVYLKLDTQALQEHGYNPSSVKLEIKTDAYYQATLLLNQYKNKVTENYNNNLINENEHNTLHEGITIIEQNWNDKNEYLIGFQFKNSTMYKKYYEIMNGSTSSNNIKKVKKTFYTKTYHYGTTNYGDYSIFNKIYTYYTNSKFAQISPQETNLTYTYSVSSRRYHSDADNIMLDGNGNYLHTWNVDPNNPARQIYFYTITANRGSWIAVCLILGITICVILGIIGLLKNLKSKNNLKEINEIDENNN